jgi:hypothetical protein
MPAMSERLPWTTKTALAALVLVFGVGLLGFGLLVAGNSLGWLALVLAGWFTLGLVYTAYGTGRDGEP